MTLLQPTPASGTTSKRSGSEDSSTSRTWAVSAGSPLMSSTSSLSMEDSRMHIPGSGRVLEVSTSNVTQISIHRDRDPLQHLGHEAGHGHLDVQRLVVEGLRPRPQHPTDIRGIVGIDPPLHLCQGSAVLPCRPLAFFDVE